MSDLDELKGRMDDLIDEAYRQGRDDEDNSWTWTIPFTFFGMLFVLFAVLFALWAFISSAAHADSLKCPDGNICLKCEQHQCDGFKMHGNIIARQCPPVTGNVITTYPNGGAGISPADPLCTPQ